MPLRTISAAARVVRPGRTVQIAAATGPTATPSIHPKIAVRAAVRVGHGRSPSDSRFSVAKNDSASALSRH
ncbi:hypothetical protein AB0K51_14910 [Kitasatospora sp. NPDC049285]|uniref:hypothetical protein n=1 Tax=Kitasatospora sp. NPDC049285 TaxID=3157096 RepID=UPI0034492730